MRTNRWALLALLLLASPRFAAAEGMPRNAFLLEARLGGATAFTFSGTSLAIITAPSLLLGARLVDRIHLGLGFALYRSASASAANTTFAFVPTFEADLVKAADNRVGFYAKLGIALGDNIAEMMTTANVTHFVVGYDTALGVRYCPHPNFAAGLEAGVFGLFTDPTSKTNSSGTTAVYGAVVGTFFWGR